MELLTEWTVPLFNFPINFGQSDVFDQKKNSTVL